MGGLELLVGGVAVLVVVVALAEGAEEVDVLDLLGLGLDAGALEVVPARAPALGLVAALDPEGFLDDLPADALLLLLVVVCLGALGVLVGLGLLLGRTLGLLLLALVLALALLRLVDVLLLEVVEDHAFEVEGVEEGALGEGLDVVGVDGADLEGVLALLDHLGVFGDVGDLGVGCVDGLQELVLVPHRLDGALDALEVVLVVGVPLDQLYHLLPLPQRHRQSELQQRQVLHVHRRPAHFNYKPPHTHLPNQTHHAQTPPQPHTRRKCNNDPTLPPQHLGLRHGIWVWVSCCIIIRGMFPHSYTYNPGVVLDPVTMTPMITHGGNITVNPLGVPMRPEQKVWQKMFIKNIPQECSNETMQRLLNEFGAIKNFKRALDNRGRLLPFCHFDLETGEEILRIRRLFVNIRVLNNVLEIKISPETENFIKEWMGMQRDEWRKKLAAPGMNEAKEFDTIEQYHMRDDKKYKQRIDDLLHLINGEVKKVAQEKAKEEERKEHPREKEREKARRKALEDQDRNFNQKEDQWLRRERDKQKDYRKDKEREREREKQRLRRLEKEIALEDEEFEARALKFLTEERRQQVRMEEEQDDEIMMEENPPLPEEQVAEQPEDAQPVSRKVKVVAEEDIILGEEKVEEVLVEAPRPADTQEPAKPKELPKNQLFEGYEKIYEEPQQKEFLELNLPEVVHEEVDLEEEQRRREAIRELEKAVPQNRMELWQFPIDWDKLSKSTVLERRIRPWLEEMSNEYMGGVEEKFIALVEKKLLSRSHPDKIIKIMKQLLDDDSEEFVIKLWKKLVLEYLKLQNGLI